MHYEGEIERQSVGGHKWNWILLFIEIPRKEFLDRLVYKYV